MRKKKEGIILKIVLCICIVFLCVLGVTYWQFAEQNHKLNIVSNQEMIGKVITQNVVQEQIQQEESANELFEEYYDKAILKMQEMTLEEKVSQMFLARCPANDSIKQVKEEQPGGYILFGRDFENKTEKQVIDMVQEFQNASKIPMIIGVDEEGGSVVRVSRNTKLVAEKYKSPQELYAQGGLSKIREDAIQKSQRLKNLGINLNLTPVADVSTNPKDFIYDRSFGNGAIETAEYVRTVVDAMQSQNMACTLKHFPGYGDNKDSHNAVTYDNRILEEFQTSDFLPFKAGIEAGAPTILVCHNIVNSIEKNVPASLSTKVHKILKEELGFSGLILTDDLAMEAVAQYTSLEEVAILAVKAGNDVLLSSDFVKQRDAIVKAVKNKEITENRIEESVKKILAYKFAMELM